MEVTKRQKRIQKIKINTFSKCVMSIIVSLYFIGALLGTILVILSAMIDVKNQISVDPSMFIAYATYLGAPTATAIVFYAWKDKAENVIKIAQSFKLDQVEQLEQSENTQQLVEVMDVLSRIGGI